MSTLGTVEERLSAVEDNMRQVIETNRRLIDVLERLNAPPAPRPVLTTAEAAEYTGHRSDTAFYRWAARVNVSQCGAGKWLREQLDYGLRIAAAQRKIGQK